ncbi:MAG: copper homeostasis protein CutC [Eubacteriales bacterium]|nr:copper homeostasis protein CutC [Clostridiales bacterium]MDD7396938.1 copper homeostasis protein CutC [Eubacteriales bacterium]MDY2983429.1 copper homeostasis protein CutC [Eubacteriales bacterium]
MDMEKKCLEICCGSAGDAIAAFTAGADRVELNSCLFFGGLTPTLGTLEEVLDKAPGKPVMAMVRPRAGGFCYDKTEFSVACREGEALLRKGAAGLVFGFLREDGTPDSARIRVFTEMTRSYGRESVFHRAVDVVPDWRKALDVLMEQGVTRVLTSGQAPTALAGAACIRHMREYAAGRIEILPGAGIRLHNLQEVLRLTGCRQVHMSAHSSFEDCSAQNTRGIVFSGNVLPPESQVKRVDTALVRALVETLQKKDR